MGRIADIGEESWMGVNCNKCAFCDNKPTAYWHGINANVAVCAQCAEDVLPRLIADAIHLGFTGKHPHGIADDSFKRCELSFWQAIATRLSSVVHEMRQGKKPRV